MGPYGPGGYEISLNIATPKHTYSVALSPLSWGLGYGRTKLAIQIRILCIKITVQHAIWDTEDA